jgi:hypothetical protein
MRPVSIQAISRFDRSAACWNILVSPLYVLTSVQPLASVHAWLNWRPAQHWHAMARPLKAAMSAPAFLAGYHAALETLETATWVFKAAQDARKSAEPVS